MSTFGKQSQEKPKTLRAHPTLHQLLFVSETPEAGTKTGSCGFYASKEEAEAAVPNWRAYHSHKGEFYVAKVDAHLVEESEAED